MVANAGDGVAATSELVCTSTVFAFCTAMFKVDGAVSGHTGTCGGRTTTTSDLAGSGVVIAVLVDTCTVNVFGSAGMGHTGARSAVIGIAYARISSTTAYMGAHGRPGVASGALVSTSTASASSGATDRASGAPSASSGSCGRRTTITKLVVGVGEVTAESHGTCTA